MSVVKGLYIPSFKRVVEPLLKCVSNFDIKAKFGVLDHSDGSAATWLVLSIENFSLFVVVEGHSDCVATSAVELVLVVIVCTPA